MKRRERKVETGRTRISWVVFVSDRVRLCKKQVEPKFPRGVKRIRSNNATASRGLLSAIYIRDEIGFGVAPARTAEKLLPNVSWLTASGERWMKVCVLRRVNRSKQLGATEPLLTK